MYENFIKLESDKQQRILNAAFELFAKNGYKRASTLDICEKAAISKGALFHYFGNKRNLFFYLYDIGVAIIMEEMLQSDFSKNSDFFARMEGMSKAKMKAMKTHPFVYAFFVKIYSEEDKSVHAELSQRLRKLSSNQSSMLDDIDQGKFRKEVDLNVLCNLIVNFAVEFLQTKFTNDENTDMEEIMNEFQLYIDMLRENFYKEEFL